MRLAPLAAVAFLLAASAASAQSLETGATPAGDTVSYTVSDTVSETLQAAATTVEPVTETVEPAGGVVDQVTDTTDQAADPIEPVDNLVEDVGQVVDETVVGAEQTVDETLQTATKTVEPVTKTVEPVTKTVEPATKAIGEPVGPDGPSTPGTDAEPAPPSPPSTPSPSAPASTSTIPSAAPDTGPEIAVPSAPRENVDALEPETESTVPDIPSPKGDGFPGLADVGDAISRFIEAVPDWAWPLIFVFAALALIASLRSYVEGRRRRRLASESRRLSDDLLLLQSTLLPRVGGRLGPLEVSAAYRPADGLASGGDFYDVLARSDGSYAFIVGDVSGHGREAIARAALTRYTLRAFLSDGYGPAAALEATDRVLARELDIDSFVTALAVVYDPAASTLVYAQAGHHPPIFSGFGAFDPEGAPAGPPLGGGLATEWPEVLLGLVPGAKMCLFTDGLVEARLEDGTRYGRERLVTLLDGPRSSEEVLSLVSTQGQAVDDMALLRIEFGAERVDVEIVSTETQVARA